MFVFRVLNTVPYSNESGAKDVVASLHSFFTTNVLVGLAVLVSWKQFGGKPIECMVPTEFTSAWVQYAENYCWAQDTHFVPFTDLVANTEDEKYNAKYPRVSYYQWIPFFLLFEAACFKMPCLIWKYFASQSGMRVGDILRLATDDHNTVPEVKKANIDALCIHLQGALRFQKRLKSRNLVPHKILRFLNVKYSTFYVVFIYFLSKFAFLVNGGFQSKLLNKYLLPANVQNHLGYSAWLNLWSGNNTWEESGLFPRVTLCDFEVREQGNLQTHTVQCVLLINMFTEKIFVFLWGWYLVLTAFTVCNIISWIFILFSETSKEHFIINHLEMCETPFDRSCAESMKHVDRFIELYLGLDGVFLLQLISQHADVVFTTELIGSLWRSHYDIEEQRRALKATEKILPVDKTVVDNNKPSPDVPNRSRNPRSSVPTLKRTASFNDAEIESAKKFDDSSDEETAKDSKTPSVMSRASSKKAKS